MLLICYMVVFDQWSYALNDLLDRVQDIWTGLCLLLMSPALHHRHQVLLLSLPENSGAANMNFCSPVLATVWAWEMSGGSPTSATETEEVSDSTLNMNANLFGCTECKINTSYSVKYGHIYRFSTKFILIEIYIIGEFCMRYEKFPKQIFHSCLSWSCKMAMLTIRQFLIMGLQFNTKEICLK